MENRRVTEILKECTANIRKLGLPLVNDEFIDIHFRSFASDYPADHSIIEALPDDLSVERIIISISELALFGEDTDEDIIKAVIYHELIHTITRKDEHDVDFVMICEMIETFFGVNPKWHATMYEIINGSKPIYLPIVCKCGADYSLKDENYADRIIDIVENDMPGEWKCSYCNRNLYETVKDSIEEKEMVDYVFSI